MSEHTSQPQTIVVQKPLLTGKFLLRLILVIIGALIFAVGLELFLVPNQVMDGGIVGISIMASHIFGIPSGVFIFILNIPFLYLGYKQIGRTFAITTAVGITVLSVATIYLHSFEPFTNDVLLATVFGGIILGVGVGLVIRFGGSLDGTEILAILFTKKLPFSVGEIIMFINLLIFSAAGFVFTWEQAMYSVIAYYIAAKVIDIVVEGLDESKSIHIISDHADVIGQAIMDRLGRGVTFLNGQGAYTGDDKKVIFTVVTRIEESKLKSLVQELDPNAFMSISNAAEVSGGRFKKKDIH